MFNLNESLPWKQAPSRRPRNPHDLKETAYIGLPLATQLGRLSPFVLRNVVVGCEALDDPPVIRLTHVRGRLLVRLRDVPDLASAASPMRGRQ
jgi:hypothetical protein